MRAPHSDKPVPESYFFFLRIFCFVVFRVLPLFSASGYFLGLWLQLFAFCLLLLAFCFLLSVFLLYAVYFGFLLRAFCLLLSACCFPLFEVFVFCFFCFMRFTLAFCVLRSAFCFLFLPSYIQPAAFSFFALCLHCAALNSLLLVDSTLLPAGRFWLFCGLFLPFRFLFATLSFLASWGSTVMSI